jgi:glycosyltransferase involved in cell wall biosynthesis
MKICRVATVPFMLHNHLRQQVVATIAAGHIVTLVSSDGPEVSTLRQITGSQYQIIEIPRKISLKKDFLALIQLYQFFRKQHFDIVHSVTPKAGLLCAIAAFLARVPVRLHTFTGQPWVELHGCIRLITIWADKLIARLNSYCYTDSHSQRDFLIEQGILDKDKSAVIGSGSVAGLDLTRFNREVWSAQYASIRDALAVPADAKVITFIGRITRDKGIVELLYAFNALQQKNFNCVLLLIGPSEIQTGSLPEDVLHILANNPQIRNIGYTQNPEKYLAITDFLCLPSYREGFGGVVIEAAAMGVPAIGTDIVGLRDAIVADVTGLLVPSKDSEKLKSAMEYLLSNDAICKKLGQNAYRRAHADFDAHIFNQLFLAEYNNRFHQ